MEAPEFRANPQSRLLGLPAELRTKILTHCIAQKGRINHPYTLQTVPLIRPPDCPVSILYESYRNYLWSYQEKRAWLQTNKQIYSEGVKIWAENRDFSIRNVEDLEFLNEVVLQESRRHVRYLTVEPRTK